MNLVENLMRTGLTRHESELYIALSREGELTGYEAAKITGIPRANAYQALSGLVDKGGAYMIEGAVLHYAAVAVEEYCRNISRSLMEVTAQIVKECPVGKTPAEAYITIRGFSHILDKLKNMIEEARERLYISLSEKEFAHIRQELTLACQRGLKVVAIASGEVFLEGMTVYKISKKPGPVRLIVDSSQVLTGELEQTDVDTCLYSRNKPLVELIKSSLKNEIKLAEMEEGKSHA